MRTSLVDNSWCISYRRRLNCICAWPLPLRNVMILIKGTRTYRITVASRKRWPKISQAGFFLWHAHRSSTYVKTCNSIFFKRFSVDSRKRIKTTRIAGCVFNDNKNALAWAGPKENNERMCIQSYLLFSILWPLVANGWSSFIRIIICLTPFYLQSQLCVPILEWWNMVIIHR